MGATFTLIACLLHLGSLPLPQLLFHGENNHGLNNVTTGAGLVLAAGPIGWLFSQLCFFFPKKKRFFFFKEFIWVGQHALALAAWP